MASAYVQGDTNLQFGSAEGSVSLSGVGSGNTLYAVFAWSSVSETLTSIQSDVDGAFTLLDNPTTDGSEGRIAHGYLFNATSGSHTITTTRSANTASCELHVYELSGAINKVANVINVQSAPGTGTDAVTSTAIATATDGILIGVSFDIGQATKPNLGTGMTACTVGTTPTLGLGGRKATAGAGPTALTWTETEAFANTGSTAIAFSPTAGGDGSAALSGSAGTGGQGTAVPNFQIPL